MSEFKIAEAETGRAEGLYANNTSDRGKETFAGIARKWWPNWKGWPIIDEIKRKNFPSGTDFTDRATWTKINKYAKERNDLPEMISSFYKINFWNINQLDRIKDQQIANTVYDFSVNAGEDKAAETLQESVNTLLTVPPTLLVDGDIGRKTIEAVNKMTPSSVHGVYNALREKHYRKLAKDPSQKQFLEGWLKRLKPYKTC